MIKVSRDVPDFRAMSRHLERYSLILKGWLIPVVIFLMLLASVDMGDVGINVVVFVVVAFWALDGVLVAMAVEYDWLYRYLYTKWPAPQSRIDCLLQSEQKVTWTRWVKAMISISLLQYYVPVLCACACLLMIWDHFG